MACVICGEICSRRLDRTSIEYQVLLPVRNDPKDPRKGRSCQVARRRRLSAPCRLRLVLDAESAYYRGLGGHNGNLFTKYEMHSISMLPPPTGICYVLAYWRAIAVLSNRKPRSPSHTVTAAKNRNHLYRLTCEAFHHAERLH